MTTDEIRAELAKAGKIALIWATEDVQSVRDDLSDTEAMMVLEEAERRHDAASGVTWDTLQDIAAELFPKE